jgi:hypothetical protein
MYNVVTYKINFFCSKSSILGRFTAYYQIQEIKSSFGASSPPIPMKLFMVMRRDVLFSKKLR